MADEEQSKPALVPVREQTVEFYGDDIMAAQVADGTVWVPLRPIADQLGLNWSGQYLRIRRDDLLSESVGVCIMQTPSGKQDMMCLPLKLLPGWLFGINASRVKEELRAKARFKRNGQLASRQASRDSCSGCSCTACFCYNRCRIAQNL